MARAGGGNYWYVESDDQMAGIFEGEIEGLVALAAQNVEVEVRLTHPRVAGVSFLQSYPVQQTADGGWRVALHDLYATSPKALGLLFHVEDVARPRQGRSSARSASRPTSSPRTGIEHRTTTMPVFANLDGEERVEPIVEQTFLRFQAARAREEAVRRADDGDFDGAASSLRDAAASFLHCRGVAGDGRGDRGSARTEAVRLERAAVRRERPEVSGRARDGREGHEGGLRAAGEPAAAAEGVVNAPPRLAQGEKLRPPEPPRPHEAVFVRPVTSGCLGPSGVKLHLPK